MFVSMVSMIMLLLVISGFTPTERYWDEVGKAAEEGLPRTAIKNLDKILKIAQQKKDYSEWLRALSYKIALEATIQGNKPEEKVKRIKEEFKRADPYTKPLLQAILAQWYWHYYQKNRYRFAKRSPTELMTEEDFTTWDLRKLFNEMDSLYQDVLKQKNVLVTISIEEFVNFLEPGNTPLKLRPTLYDFIAHEAISFYTRGEAAAVHPEDAFEIDAHSAAFGPLDEFLSYKAKTEDSASAKLKTIQLYQSLLEHHREKGNTGALLDLELQRLRYVYNSAIGADIDEVFIKRLEEFVREYGGYPVSSLASYYLARSWAKEGDLKKAYGIAEKGFKRFPESNGGQFCQAYMIQLRSKSLSLTAEKYIAPGKSKMLVRYKNFSKLYFRIYKDRWDGFMVGERKYLHSLWDGEIEEMLSKPSLEEWSVELPETEDFRERKVEIDLPELEKGFYYVLASWQPDFLESTYAVYTCVTVSTLTMVTRSRLDVFNGLVLDALSGEPLPDVLVCRILHYRGEYRYADTTYTNSDGMFTYEVDEDSHPGFLYIRKDDDELFVDRGLGKEREHPDPSSRATFFFTDRSIYRPGQTIHFKGICVRIDREGNDYEVLPDRNVTVWFNDTNGKEITRNTFRTNEFGSFSGHFIAPADRLTGRMSISVKDPRGSASFNVEEYKRPKFTVEIEKPEKAFGLNEHVTVTGKAINYTNAPVDGALVRYRVQRVTRYPRWWGWYHTGSRSSGTQIIAHGKTRTANDGTFEIPFFSKPDSRISPDEDPRFVYTIYAEVTSPDGETRSTGISVTLGYTALEVQLSSEGRSQNNKEFIVQVRTQTLDGIALSAHGTVRVYRLREPGDPIRAAFWDLYDIRSPSVQHETPKPEFSDDWQKWPRDRLVREIPFSTKKDNPQSIPIKLPAGLYQIECFAKDKNGKDVKELLPVMVLPDWGDKQFSIKLPSIAQTKNDIVYVGEDLEVLWGTGYQSGRCYVEIEHDKRIIKEYWTDADITQHTFRFPVTEAYRGGFRVHLTFVKENRAYTHTLAVQVPWDNKELSIHVKTFRDKLRPGKKEQITLSVTGKKRNLETEFLATMYDLSLDQFKPHSWRKMDFFHRATGLGARSFINGPKGFSHIRGRSAWNEQWKYPPLDTYIQFPEHVVKDYLFYRFPVIGGGNVSYLEEKPASGKLGMIKGKVIDASNGEPLPFANIVIRETTMGTVTDLNGDFFIINVPFGTYAVEARMMGYRNTLVYRVKVSKDATAVVHFRLPLEVVTMSGVTVVGGSDPVEALLTNASMCMSGEAEPRDGGGYMPGIDVKGIQIRRVLDETAFFYPHLPVGKNGTVKLEFNCPETLTKWKFLGFAHGKQCESGIITEYAVSQKDLMVQPNPPRFLREGDRLLFAAKVVNASGAAQSGKVQLDFMDIITGGPANEALGMRNRVQEFDIEAHSSGTFYWHIEVPKGMNPVTYTVVAKSENHSDGETGSLPVLSSRIYLTESLPLHIRGHQTRNFTFSKLEEMGESETVEPYRFTIQITSNPAWYAIQALPYLAAPLYGCSDAIFNRYYANSLAHHIALSDSRIEMVFNEWRGTDALKSNLEKNEALKSVCLAETPWIMDAREETQAKRNVGLLFEENNIRNGLNAAFYKLQNMQYENGSWPWFPGGKPNSYITLCIMTGFGRLRHLGVETDISLALKSVHYLDSLMYERYTGISKKSENHLTHHTAFYLYGRSFFLAEKPVAPAHQEAIEYFLEQAQENWLKLNSRLSQGYLALALHRFGKDKAAKKIMASIKERSVQDEEMGMFWQETERSWWWYRAPIETQSLMIEAFLEIMNDEISAEECRIWLLKQKQTRHWRTTKATADAIYAIILRGTDLLSSSKVVPAKLGDEIVTPEKVEAGTGFYEMIYGKEDIRADFANIEIKKEDKGIAWGGCYFQYFDELSSVKPHETNLKLEKKLFVSRETKKGRVIQPIAGALSVGDLVTVRIVLRADRDMEYVHLKDQRGSGLEPVDVLSHYRYQDGLRYYQSTKDVVTHFFIDYLRKGTYVFEYDLRVQHRGEYESGIAEIQCMYAPEFSSHSESHLLKAE